MRSEAAGSGAHIFFFFYSGIILRRLSVLERNILCVSCTYMVKSIILCNIGFLLSIVCEYASEYIKKKVKKKTVAKSSCAWLILGVKSKNAYTPWFYILLFYTYRYCLHREYITRA